MKYSMNVVKKDNEFFWQVKENASHNIIGEFFFEEDAKKKVDFFSNGGGFDGWGPAFIYRKPKLPKDAHV